MAKITKAISLKNAEINMEDMTITETTKDDIKSIFIGQVVGGLESYKWYFSYH